MVYKITLVKDEPTHIPLISPVLGTVVITGSGQLKSSILALPNIPTRYNYADYFPEAIDPLFSSWQSMYTTAVSTVIAPPTGTASNNTTVETGRIIHGLRANNNVWKNHPSKDVSDLIVDNTHPFFIVDNLRAYNWYIQPQGIDATTGLNKGIGTLIMDSPRVVETHAALQAGKYAVNEIDPTKPRVANLGHLVERIAALLAYRPLADGTFKKDDEKKLVKTLIPSKQVLDPTKIGVNNFASDGMVMRRLTNSFDGDKVTADQCVIVYDILQVMAEYQDQQNLALGLQESSAIQIKDKDETARYGSQLALMLELLNLAKSTHAMARSALISSLVAQAQSSETIAALGLPTVTKTIPIQTDGKIEHLPYMGVSPHRSISQEIATCTTNVGIVLGQLL